MHVIFIFTRQVESTKVIYLLVLAINILQGCFIFDNLSLSVEKIITEIAPTNKLIAVKLIQM